MANVSIDNTLRQIRATQLHQYNMMAIMATHIFNMQAQGPLTEVPSVTHNGNKKRKATVDEGTCQKRSRQRQNEAGAPPLLYFEDFKKFEGMGLYQLTFIC